MVTCADCYACPPAQDYFQAQSVDAHAQRHHSRAAPQPVAVPARNSSAAATEEIELTEKRRDKAE